MIEELQRIDTSSIEELQTIKGEQDILQQRLDAMQTRSKDVSVKVFERVRADYQGRYHALEEQARPLKAQARAEFARLAALNQRLIGALEDARLAREELEFRNELGEFEGKEYSQRLAEAERLVQECETQVSEGEKLRARFVAAFHSEEELTALEEGPTAGTPAGPGAGDQPGAAPETAELGEFPTDATMVPPVPEDSHDNGVPSPAEPEVDATQFLGPVGEPPVSGPSDSATAVLRPAHLVQEDSGEEFQLAMTATTLGRAPDNTITIPDGTISRHHARVELTEHGFTIVDLGSENGIFVNGERVTERLLASGDQIEVGPGTRRYTFVWA